MPGNLSRFNYKWFLVGTLMYLSIFSHADAVDQDPSYEAFPIMLDLLLKELNIPHDTTLESMISVSQVWPRKPGQGQWELP